MKYRILFQGIFLPLVLILIFTSLTADAQKAYEFHTKNKKAVTHFLKASRMYDAKQLLNARDELEAALKEDPEFLEAAMLMGDVTTDLNDFQKAVTYYRKAVLSDPDFFPQNFFNLAQAEIQLSEFDSAVSHLEIFLTYKFRKY